MELSLFLIEAAPNFLRSHRYSFTVEDPKAILPAHLHKPRCRPPSILMQSTFSLSQPSIGNRPLLHRGGPVPGTLATSLATDRWSWWAGNSPLCRTEDRFPISCRKGSASSI